MSSRSPLRTTWARVDVMTLSWSIIILARISWKMPITMLATMTAMNTRLLYAPVRKMATPKMTFTKLNSVQRLSLKMRPMLLEVTSVLTFTLPAATRSVISAEVRPVSLAASFCSIAFMPTMIAVSQMGLLSVEDAPKRHLRKTEQEGRLSGAVSVKHRAISSAIA